MQRVLIVAGALLLLAGLAWPLLRRLPLFRLPGDLVVEGERITVHLPLTTMLLLSAVATLLLWLLGRR